MWSSMCLHPLDMTSMKMCRFECFLVCSHVYCSISYLYSFTSCSCSNERSCVMHFWRGMGAFLCAFTLCNYGASLKLQMKRIPWWHSLKCLRDGAHLGSDKRRGNLATEPGCNDMSQRCTERIVGHTFPTGPKLATCTCFHDVEARCLKAEGSPCRPQNWAQGCNF